MFMAMTLKAARVNAGLTQHQAAKIIGVSINTISRWESGVFSPSFKFVQPICDAYGLNSYNDIIFLPKNNAKSVIKSGV